MTVRTRRSQHGRWWARGGQRGNKAITLLEKRSFVCRARQGRPAPGGPPLMHEVKKQAGRGVE